MLTRAALRFQGTSRSIALRQVASQPWNRRYKSHKTPSYPAPPSSVNKDPGQGGPVANKTWPPRIVQSQNADSQQIPADQDPTSQSRITSTHSSKADQDVGANRERQEELEAYGRATQFERPPSIGSEKTAQLTEDVAQLSSEIDRLSSEISDLRARQQSDGEIAQDEVRQAQPTGPLPDLRHGIPSTFEQEFSDPSSSFKTKEAESPNLNIVEDPALAGQRGEGDLPPEAYVSSIDRRKMRVARYMYIAFGTFAVVGSIFLGRGLDEHEKKQNPSVSNGWDPSSIYTRMKLRLTSKLDYYTEPTSHKLLPDADPNGPPYTLVVSLEDLLVHSEWNRKSGYQVAKRPGVDYFIQYLNQYYELVLFTSVASMNAEPVWRKLDPFGFLRPLWREQTRYANGNHLKDLSYLNRDLSKTIIIDTVHGHVQTHPENAIVLPKWSGKRDDPHTKDLVALIPLLEYIAGMGIEDVRKVIESYKDCDSIPEEFQRREAKAREEFNKRLAESKSRRGGVGMGSLSKAMGFKSPGYGIPGEPTTEEGFAQGKMLSDQMRERGQREYTRLAKDLRENGEKYLKEMEEENKRLQDEAVASMQADVMSSFGGFLGNRNKTEAEAASDAKK